MGTSGFHVLENQIRDAILDYIKMFPRKGFAFPIYNGGVWDPVKKIFRKSSRHYRKGLPDIHGIWVSRPLYIEVKRPGGRASSEQKEFIAEALEHNAIAFVTCDVLEARRYLEKFQIDSIEPLKKVLSLTEPPT